MSKVLLCTARSTPQAFHFYIARAYSIINLQVLYQLFQRIDDAAVSSIKKARVEKNIKYSGVK